MSKFIYIVTVYTYDGNTNKATDMKVSQVGYDTVEGAKQFIESRGGETISSKLDGWSVAKVHYGKAGWTQYKINEIFVESK